jgi:hypothetical protein
MSLVKSPEMTEEKLAAQRGNGQKSQGPATPEGKERSAASNLRHGFYATSRPGVLMALGENPEDYLRLLQSLHEDLQPQDGFETQLVLHIRESFWRMERAQRMQEGLAVKRIESRIFGEDMMATQLAAKAIENFEPFERLMAALSRRGGGPTEEEIQAFVQSRKLDDSEKTREFIALLQSLNAPMEKKQRQAARRSARVSLRALMEGYESAAWCMARRMEKVKSPENLAALAAPTEDNHVLLQRMEDSNLRRLWRLTNLFIRARQGGLTRKDVKNEDRSHDVYENKGQDDKMSHEKADIFGN